MNKKILLVFAGLVFGLLLLTLPGCDGISGDRGLGGDEGPGGKDYIPPIPANRFFSMGIANNSLRSHNGAPKLYLAFDSTHHAAGDTVVSQQLAKGRVPNVDGLDGGTDEWGELVTDVNLVRGAGDYNFIESARVRSAFDNDYIYFQVSWTEVANEDFGLTASNSNNPLHWIYPADGLGGNLDRWDLSTTNEDRLNFFFEITPVTRYSSDGCYVTCHTNEQQVNLNYHATRGSREKMDIWHWTSGTNNSTGYATDRYMIANSQNGVRDDLGTLVARLNLDQTIVNVTDTQVFRPQYMSFGDPNSNSGFPLWDYEITRVSFEGWQPGSTIPAYINSIPWGSTADIEAVGVFDDASSTWTVEMKRKRFTGNGDDARF